jgi:ribonucleoside-diphosphate reductase alpha chain/ribonucleoside-triphosphate reductase
LSKVLFNKEKIVVAVGKAMAETGLDSQEVIDRISLEIAEFIEKKIVDSGNKEVDIDFIQDLVEESLMARGKRKGAKLYILYRAEKDRERLKKKHAYKYLSKEFLSNYKHQTEPFKTEIGKFVYLRTYSRPIPEEGRRENWLETVSRTVEHNISLAKWKSHSHAVAEAEKMFDSIYNLRQFPSGRALWSAGISTSITNPISQFNCSFSVFDNFDIVKDSVYLLMLGVGFGFSVENQYVNNLPSVRNSVKVHHKSYVPIKPNLRKENTEYSISGNIMEVVVGDSKIGWSVAMDLIMRVFYSIEFANVEALLLNYNNIRPFGQPLKTFGGTSSGYTALQIMIEKVVKILLKDNDGRKQLQPLDCMDIIDSIAEGIVVGGTRRSACATLISPEDKETQNAKMELYQQNEKGEWVVNESILHRMMSNNSTAYWSKPSYNELKQRFEVIKHSAENNFFNMESAVKRKPNVKGTNP